MYKNVLFGEKNYKPIYRHSVIDNKELIDLFFNYFFEKKQTSKRLKADTSSGNRTRVSSNSFKNFQFGVTTSVFGNTRPIIYQDDIVIKYFQSISSFFPSTKKCSNVDFIDGFNACVVNYGEGDNIYDWHLDYNGSQDPVVLINFYKDNGSAFLDLDESFRKNTKENITTHHFVNGGVYVFRNSNHYHRVLSRGKRIGLVFFGKRYKQGSRSFYLSYRYNRKICRKDDFPQKIQFYN